MNRQAILDRLKTRDVFDLSIGGGGIAVDAASRGLKVALVEKNDFAEGTGSKSAKLVHGGVRFLEMAVKKRDRAQYRLVREALFGRGIFLRNAPGTTNAASWRRWETAETVETESARERLRILADCKHIS